MTFNPEADYIEAEEIVEDDGVAEADEDADHDCTCGWTRVGPTDIDPPSQVVSRDCSVHGIDPDRVNEDRRDRLNEDAHLDNYGDYGDF